MVLTNVKKLLKLVQRSQTSEGSYTLLKKARASNLELPALIKKMINLNTKNTPV